ncbi:MAG: hypothetical protein KKF89_04315, partial [Nanoarchaeota archaeon]|nr:hypothetical protein [Nanoarchaeota archaeon]
LPNFECVQMSRYASLNIDRAMRSVSQSETAATGGFGIVCPCPTNYMHEDISAKQAESMGLIKTVSVSTDNIGEVVLDYIGSEHYHESKVLRVHIVDCMIQNKNIMNRILDFY